MKSLVFFKVSVGPLIQLLYQFGTYNRLSVLEKWPKNLMLRKICVRLGSICRYRIFWWGQSQISDLTNDFLENTGFKLAVDLSFQIQTSLSIFEICQFQGKHNYWKDWWLQQFMLAKVNPLWLSSVRFMLSPVKSSYKAHK